MSEQQLEHIRAAKRELDAVIGEIRTVDGFEDFLAPPTFEDVAHAAEQIPLVYIAAVEQGGLALIVRAGDVELIELKDLTSGLIRGRLDGHLQAYDARHHDAGAQAGWILSLDEVTAWLWTVAMGPVLARLDASSEAVLVACGLLGLLPLHAAWTADASAPTGRRYAIDAVALSYAPNARSLQAARARAQRLRPERLVAVVDPRPVSAAALPSAVLEGELARAAFPYDPIILSHGAATPGNLRRSAAGSRVLHLACHGFADLDSPLDSGLALAGGRVTLRDLMALSLDVRLALLSACETSLPGTALPDEVVALPTGLLQAGVAGVVASMWAVPDRATAMLMAEFYRGWRWEQNAPAAALRDAQQWLRDKTNDEKIRHWEGALANRSPWLPESVAETFIQHLAYREPDAREQAGIRAWGAFAHVGA